MDKLDIIINKLETMQKEINDIKCKVQITINNQIKITNALNQNFQTIVNKQVDLAIVLKESYKDAEKKLNNTK
jgi:hypothetical protein